MYDIKIKYSLTDRDSHTDEAYVVSNSVESAVNYFHERVRNSDIPDMPLFIHSAEIFASHSDNHHKCPTLYVDIEVVLPILYDLYEPVMFSKKIVPIPENAQPNAE